MDNNQIYQTIKQLTEDQQYDKALNEVNQYLNTNPKDDWALYLKGNIFKKQELWQEAINTYTEAIAINRNNPALTMRRICIDILNFYDTQMFNH